MADILLVIALAIAFTIAIIAYQKSLKALAEIEEIKRRMTLASDDKALKMSVSIGRAEGELLGRKNHAEERRGDLNKATVAAAKVTVASAAETAQAATEPVAARAAKKTVVAAEETLAKAQKN